MESTKKYKNITLLFVDEIEENTCRGCFFEDFSECAASCYGNRKKGGIFVTTNRSYEDTKDALYIQEIINDLKRHTNYNGKAMEMLCEWSRELKTRCGLRGRRKKVFMKECGRSMW